MLYKKLPEDMNKNLVPGTREAYVGIEIEFFTICTRNEIINKIFKYQLQYVSSLVTDRSVVGSDYVTFEGELRILTRQSTLKTTLDRVGELLKAISARVNKSCGLHVHLDMRHGRNSQEDITSLLLCQTLLYRMNPIERRYSKYCKPGTKDLHTRDRYYGINTEAIRKHGTIEVRIHKGTVDTKEIYLWTSLLIYMRDRRMSHQVIRPSDLLLPPYLEKYVKTYYNKYKKEHDGT
jgi:hypothetical protein